MSYKKKYYWNYLMLTKAYTCLIKRHLEVCISFENSNIVVFQVGL